jgi:site-specific DNA-methyltransferase (adenine-specific)
VRPYYEHAGITIYHGDCREVLPSLGRKVAATITDPPYDANTHKMAKTNAGGPHATKAVHFQSFTVADLRETLALAAGSTERWIVATVDYRHAVTFHDAPPDGLRLLRIGVWTKPNPMPQISGDRPGQGWEAIAFLHKTDTRPSWHGGGRSSTWHFPVEQNQGHPTAKPLLMVRDWVRLFTDPGDEILDPFMGSGTTLQAAKEEGRRAIGIELEERYCELAARRLAQDSLFAMEAA